MKILLTNNKLDNRGGTESFVRDVARAMQERGHQVMAYGSYLGEGERLFERDEIPVTVDPSGLDFRPDIIHGQHHMDAMTAMACLPGVPALFHCHGAVWQEALFRHPRVVRYMTMSRTMAQRLSIEYNLKIEEIEVVYNCVDLKLYHHVRDAPEVLRKALFYNGRHDAGSPTFQAVERMCRRRGISMDCCGYKFDHYTARPWEKLPRYDLVFASGRSAIDALASGCAVMVLGRNTCGPLVKPSNFRHFREVNFSMAGNQPPPGDEDLEGWIASYDAAEAVEATRLLREAADSRKLAVRLEEVYREAAECYAANPSTPEADLVATGQYLRKLVNMVKVVDQSLYGQGIQADKLALLLDLKSQLRKVHEFLEGAIE